MSERLNVTVGCLCLTLSNVLALHIFQCGCASSCKQDCITLPALVFLLTDFTPHHTEVTHTVLTAARV